MASACPFPDSPNSDGQYVCPNCGVSRRVRSIRACSGQKRERAARSTNSKPATKPRKKDCVNLAGPYDDVQADVDRRECGCPGNRKTAVFECKRFGEVVPYARHATLDGERLPSCKLCPIRPGRVW